MSLMKTIFGCLSLLAATGCVSLLPEAGPPSKLYTLSPSFAFKRSEPRLPLQINVERPFTYHYLDNSRIVLFKKDGHHQGTFTFVRGRDWIERLPFLLHSQVIEGLEKSNLFTTISRPEISDDGDLILQLEVRHFEIDRSSNDALAHICFAAKILRATDRRILASHIFDKYQPADGRQFSALLQALDKGWSALLNDLTDWTYDETHIYAKAKTARKS